MLDYNNRLIFVTGFGAIEFLLSGIVLIVLPLVLPKWFLLSEWESGPPILLSLLLILLTSTAFAFYLRFVGKEPLSFYIAFKVVLVCLLPIITLIILYKNKSLEHALSIIKVQNNILRTRINEFEEKLGEEEVVIDSTNKSDRFSQLQKNIIAVKSADNYIEIYYLFQGVLEKKMLRNTMKNVDSSLGTHADFIRCHRTYIINVRYILKLARNYSGYYLRMSHMEDVVPVSRQYLEQIRTSLSVTV
jgi:DNA-binding LytR/AlgR family response regulator